MSSVLTIGPWQPCGRVLSLFVTSQCCVGHNASGICKIISPLFVFLLTDIWELKFNTSYIIKEIKMPKYNVNRQKYRPIVVNELFHTHFRVWAILIVKDHFVVIYIYIISY